MADQVHKEILKTISVLMTTAFAFVAGSAGNGAIEALITEVIGESGSAVTGMLIYAVVVTIVAVVVTLIIGRLVGKAGIDIDE
jgi:ABC-type amino acid transport system permease subunit